MMTLVRTLLRRLADVRPPLSGGGKSPCHAGDDLLAHPEIARMSLRELADLPLPR